MRTDKNLTTDEPSVPVNTSLPNDITISIPEDISISLPEDITGSLPDNLLDCAGEMVGEGAEARIYHGSWQGHEVMLKYRRPKSYRTPDMDSTLRRRRCRMEARLMVDARETGVRTPFIFDIDPVNSIIVMEWVKGVALKEDINRDNCRKAGEAVGRLHGAGIIHGDLTTSNIIVTPDGSLCFIDFGLGDRSDQLEARGVDLHVFAEAFESTHSESMELLEDFFAGYGNAWSGAEEAIGRCHEITRRGRYR